jgi:SAM-dependent methyltransferase
VSPQPTANPDLAKRIASLSPEKRALLRKLLANDGKSEPAPTAAVDIASEQAPVQGENATLRRFYDAVNRNLNSTPFGSEAAFLNFGYFPDGRTDRAAIALPEHRLNKNCVRLVLELVADTDVTGRAVLDVGCGRGGTLSVLNEYFQPSRTIGLDLCHAAVAFCGRQYARGRFINGDAEHLPFPDRTFEIVTNVESSHTYPTIANFYREVQRVLKPGGVFLYTDLQPRQQLTANIDLLREMGFGVEIERDITANVLASCDATAATHLAAFAGTNDAELMGNFLGMPSSAINGGMKDGTLLYGAFRLFKG